MTQPSGSDLQIPDTLRVGGVNTITPTDTPAGPVNPGPPSVTPAAAGPNSGGFTKPTIPGGDTEIYNPLDFGQSQEVDYARARERDASLNQREAHIYSDLQSKGYPILNGKVYQSNPDGTLTELDKTSIPRDVFGMMSELDLIKQARDDNKSFVSDVKNGSKTGLYAATGGAIDSYISNQLAMTKEVSRQVDDYIQRAKAVYSLEDSEQGASMNRQKANMDLLSWSQKNGMMPPGAGFYFDAPAPEQNRSRLSAALRSSMPDYVPPDYRGYAESIGLPAYAQGTPAGDVPPVLSPSQDEYKPTERLTAFTQTPSSPQSVSTGQRSPASPSGGQIGQNIGQSGSIPIQPPPARRLANLTGRQNEQPGSTPLFSQDEIELNHYVNATKQIQDPSSPVPRGIPPRPIKIGNTVIPADVVAQIGKWSMPIPRNARYLQPGEKW